MAYAEVFESFPPELRLPIARLVDVLRDELSISRADFAQLNAIVRELAQAQQRTELRIEELAQAQQRSEAGMGELKGVVRELTAAQQRTEIRMEDLARVVQDLAEAQKRTDMSVDKLTEEHRLFRYSFHSQIGPPAAMDGKFTVRRSNVYYPHENRHSEIFQTAKKGGLRKALRRR